MCGATAISPNGPKHGGLIIHGRSDATLNPGGVRIGTAEIYAQVEQIPQVLEAIAISQDFDNDVRVILFVRLQGRCHARRCPCATPIKKKISTGALAAPCAGQDHPDRRYPAHQIRQDHRACRP